MRELRGECAPDATREAITMSTPDTKIPTLTDPVCGADVNIASPFSCVRAGAMFCFCGEACRARFLENPTNFVVITRTEHPVAAEIAAPIHVKTFDMPAFAPTAARPGELSAPDIDRWLGGNGWRRMISSRINAWRERRHAELASREMLILYRGIIAEHPDQDDLQSYRSVIMSRTGCDPQAAQLILESASESFAQWPVRRELTFCDVVHYLTISEFLAGHMGKHWMHSDIKHIVESCIPGELCIERRVKPASAAGG